MPLRFGPFGLNPTLAVTNLGIDDNIFNDIDRPAKRLHDDGDAPPGGAAAEREGAPLGHDRHWACLLPEIRRPALRRLRNRRPTSTWISAGFGHMRWPPSSTPDERLNAEVDVARASDANHAGGGDAHGAFTQDRRRVRFPAGPRWTSADGTFFEGVPINQALNNETRTVEGGLEFYLTPLTTFSVIASRQTDRFDEAPGNDADTFRILPSIRMEAPAIMQGSLAIGYRRFSAFDPETPDYSGLVVQGSLTHTFAEWTKLDLDALARRAILLRGD